MPKKWSLRDPNPKLQAEISTGLNIPPIIAQLLVNRGISRVEDAASFLAPSLSSLHDPFLLKDMDRAVERLKQAKERGEKVMIYGDYDVDGVTSTAVVWRCLKKLGIEAVKYIPHRMDEGYGLNHEIAPLARDMGVTLLITVDCGVTASAEVETLRGEGIEVIVIDHHEPEGLGIPKAYAVVDPKRADCSYPFRDLAGVGLAAKFVQAVSGEFPKEDLDLVALGTIADVVPLRGENRIIAKFGLPILTKTAKAGLRALIRSARIEGKEMSPYTVGFVLGPRLNAAGRMGTANTSLDLVLSEDETSALALACSLEAHNRDRQKLQSSVVEEAMAMIENDEELLAAKVIVVHGDDWHKGVLGIAASKIADKYGRPTIVISMSEGLGVGSARSVEGFHLTEAFAYCADVLIEFGGHKRAAGLKVKHDRILEFRRLINAFAKDIPAEDLVPVLDIDVELPLKQVSLETIRLLDMLAPHGEGNPAPVFMTRRLLVKSRPQVMSRDTIKFWVTDGRETVSAVGFGMASDHGELRMGQAVDIAYTLGIDDWNKPAQPQILLKDLRILTKQVQE